MQPGQTLPYISDVGAFEFKPLFIAMGTVSVVTFSLSFVLEQFLRIKGRLTKNSRGQMVLGWLSIIFAIAGAAGLILLSIFDAYHHNKLHNGFLGLFIGGYVISAVFTCAEYQRLGIRYREERILRLSFWIKLAFILVEVVLAIAFGALNRLDRWNAAGVVEWVIALVYTFYVASYGVDFRPATRTKYRRHDHLHDQVANDRIAMSENNGTGIASDDAANRYHGGHQQTANGFYPSGTTTTIAANGHANGTRKEQAYV